MKEFQQETVFRSHRVLIQTSRTPLRWGHTLLFRMFTFLDLVLSGSMTRQTVSHPPQAVRTVAFLKQAVDRIVIEQGGSGAECRVELVTGAA